MKPIILLTIFLLSGCHVHLAVNDHDYYPTGETSFRLNQYFSAWTEMKKFNGVVMVKKDDKIILHEAYNINEYDIKTLHVKNSSQFDIRSISKLMAKALFFELRNQGKINTNELMVDYFSQQQFSDPRTAQITIGHLMFNQSGFPRELSSDADLSELTQSKIIMAIANEALKFSPGEDTLYSNLAFQMLYNILGRVNKSSFEDSLNSLFFQPLKMDKSGSHFFARRKNLNDYAYGHEFDGDTLVKVNLINDETFKPGIIYATADDMMRFLDYLSTVNYKQELMNPEDGKISHAGGTDGKRAYIELDLKNGYQFVFLANFDDIPFAQIIKDTRAILEGKEYQIPAPIERIAKNIPTSILQQYTGSYVFTEINDLTLEIRLEDNYLTVYQEGELNGKMSAESENIFFTDSTSGESFKFIPNGKHFNLVMDWRGAPWVGEYQENN